MLKPTTKTWFLAGVTSGALVLATVALGASGSDTIHTVVGTGVAGYSGDLGRATKSQVQGVDGIALDRHGDLYLVDSFNQRVRKVHAGIISTVVGSGKRGFAGDGGRATHARLRDPSGIAVDARGDIFVADRGNARVREVSPQGVITTIAGGGQTVGDGGPATAARLVQPTGLAVDLHGDLFITDPGDGRVREVTAAGTIRTIAGTGTRGSSAHDGPATAEQLETPYGIVVNPQGEVLIADFGTARVRKVGTDGVMTTVAGPGISTVVGDGGTATAAQLYEPSGLALDAGGNLYISDSGYYRVRKVTPAGIISTVAGTGRAGFTGDGGPARLARLYHPTGLAADARGGLYIADYTKSRVRLVGR